MSSSSTSVATYDHDDIESDLNGLFVLKNDVKGLICLDQPWNYNILREPDALSYTEFEKEWPSLAKEYKTITEHFKDDDNAAFALFRLRLSRPTEGKRLSLLPSHFILAHFLQDIATRLFQRSARGSDLKAEICQDLRGHHSDHEFLLR